MRQAIVTVIVSMFYISGVCQNLGGKSFTGVNSTTTRKLSNTLHLFDPDMFRIHKKFFDYTNDPVMIDPDVQNVVKNAMMRQVDKPRGLLHEAFPPGNNAVFGLAAYARNMRAFRRLVGSLRRTGSSTRIIFQS